MERKHSLGVLNCNENYRTLSALAGLSIILGSLLLLGGLGCLILLLYFIGQNDVPAWLAGIAGAEVIGILGFQGVILIGLGEFLRVVMQIEINTRSAARNTAFIRE